MKQWDIRVETNVNYSEIIIIHGGVDARKIETKIKIDKGKNIGKKNETSHYDQAIKDAQSKWNKKRDLEGYNNCILLSELKINDSTKPELKANLEIKFPMLAQDYFKHKNKVLYPCYVQPKIDGLRNIYNSISNQNISRQGKEFSIIKDSGKLYEELNSLPKGLILDGELYTNTLNFEKLGILRKTKKLTNEEIDNLKKIEYHIYDIIDTNLTFEQRNNIIKELHLENYDKLIYVPTFLVFSEKEIQEYHYKFLEQGFEGTMIRNKDSLYKIKQRSHDLLKFKDFQDAEFEIIDFTFEIDTSGKDQNLIVWIINVPVSIENKNYIKCKVRPMGTKEERKELYEKCKNNFTEFKGRKLWVKYFEKTKEGNLRFPTTKCNSYIEYIRDEII
jgi:ATP-dependent DNA ligase